MVNIIKTFGPAQQRGYRPPRLLLMFCSLFAIITTLPSIASAANSLSQFGITWTFDKELSTDGSGNTYQYGQFANGDYWVVGNPNVVIISIDPRSYDDNGHIKNGSMINPSPYNGSVGYDNKASYAHGMYDHSLNVAFQVNDTNPLVITPNSSLISTISYDAEDQWPQLKTAAILTVLSTAPDANSFRPAYCGSDKTIRFNESDLDYSILSELAPVGTTQSLATLEGLVERPWLDHVYNPYFGRFQPADNMACYGRDIADEVGKIGLGLHLDWGGDNNALKRNLYVRFVQVGIDLYGAVKNGMTWESNGAIFCGRKWPILFAGLALNENSDDPWASEMANIGYVSDADFQEDLDTHYVTETLIYSKPYPVQTHWEHTSYTAGTVTITAGDPYTVHGVGTVWSPSGMTAVEPNEWFCVLDDSRTNDPNGHCYQIGSVNYNNQTLTLKVPYSDNDPKAYEDAPRTQVPYKIGTGLVVGHGAPGKMGETLGADYREFTLADLGLPTWYLLGFIPPFGIEAGPEITKIYESANAGAWQGFVLAALITPGARAAWNHEELFDYEDRFMQLALEEWGEGNYNRGWSDFCEDMWDTYRADYGPVWSANPADPNNPTPVLQAIGDKSVDENSLLTFDVNATDPNGEPITYSVQSLPSVATLDPQTGDFAWTPSYNQAGIYQVTFRASDGNSWDSETITITVNNVNRPPVIGAITDQSVNENALLSLSVNATDPDGQALTYFVSGLPAGAVFASQTLTWTPSYDQAGTFPVTFTADDGQAQDSQPITITVINVNRTPVLAAINNQSVWADDPLTFTIDATDPDGDAVTYSAGTLPSSATFTGQDFDWTPSQGQMGSYNVTFTASDGQLQDSQMVTITVDVDSLAPTVTNSLPTAGSIQAPLNNLINLNIADAGKGVDAKTVTIKVNNNIVYTGDTNKHSSIYGECYRIGTKADYRFVYQSNEEFDYDQTVSITVNATDLAGNVMSENSYSFVTEMRSFGQNMMVNSGSVNLNSGRPVTVRDSSGNIWAAWHAGPIDNRDIYIGKLAAGEENFGGTVQLTDNTTDQYNPAVALDSSDKLYVVWQDNREGDWDIYVSTSVDGISWTTETRVNDPNDGDQVNPAIVIDGQSPNQAYVVWQDDRTGNQDICVATSSDGFVTTTVSQITSHISDQVEPAIAADSDNTIYIVWTDGRNGSNDIYGAASNNGLWNNVPVVTEDDGQSSPAIATEAVGSILHLVWVDDRLGDDDIYYDKTVAGLSPLTGSSIIDDTTGADQISPVIITTGYTGNDLKVFVCWRDERNADADLYFVEIGSDNETNVFVGDDGTSTDQSEPAIGIDGDDYPYLVWTNERTDICYAGSTFVEPVALASTNVSVSSTATVGTVWNAVNSLDDVSAEVPQGAYLCDVKITISKIKNPPKSNLELDLFSGTYEFGPSGMEFIEPVTITIPYEVNGSENVLYTAYWYNPLTNTLSQQGITDVETIVISSTLHAVRFKTTHFSAFILGGGVAAALGGGGGGCSVSADSEGNIVEFILPYIGLAVVMVILKMRDARYRKARST